MAAPVVAFAAYSNTGKTTYLEKLIACLKEAGLRVAVLKHDAHRIQLDVEGKDTQRFAFAGADCVAVCSPDRFAFFEQRSLPPEEAVRHLSGDIILAEGFKNGPFPRIALYRKDAGKELAVPLEECLALVTDLPPENAPCPVFPLEDPRPMAGWLIRRFRLTDGTEKGKETARL